MKRITFFQYSSRVILTGKLPAFVGVAALFLLVACSGSRRSANQYETIVVKPADASLTLPNASAEKKLIAKYAAFMRANPDSLSNIVLYAFIDKWLKTPYKYGGNDEKGIDCSGFIQRLLGDVYKIQVPRTSAQQFFTKNVEPFHDKTYFSEGDLVFFRTVPGQPISHVGLYLHNRYFVNASTSSGVSLANLDDPYWKKRFVAAGRLKSISNRQLAISDRQSRKRETANVKKEHYFHRLSCGCCH
ncbi:C40 family peptidase [Longitalea arenae]|uniref:C40 family peptidase n=1 Tax=Longitalea arenae TaxID=2812558 RepID=UPI001967D0D0|nr:NlpC/P60 family protein [Longitalea arenae]